MQRTILKYRIRKIKQTKLNVSKTNEKLILIATIIILFFIIAQIYENDD